MKQRIGIILCTSILLSGCGKKEVKIQQSPETMQDVTSSEVRSQYESDSLERNGQDRNQFIYDDAAPEIEELAFVDEDSKESASKANEEVIINLAENDADQDEVGLSWEENNKETVAFAPLKFVFDSDKLVDGQKETLAENIQKAKSAAENGDSVALNAYACQIGEEVYNLALTQRRANAMKQAYVKAGVPEDKLVAVGRGQTNPVVFSNATERKERIEQLANNRRLEMEVLSPENA